MISAISNFFSRSKTIDYKVSYTLNYDKGINASTFSLSYDPSKWDSQGIMQVYHTALHKLFSLKEHELSYKYSTDVEFLESGMQGLHFKIVVGKNTFFMTYYTKEITAMEFCRCVVSCMDTIENKQVV